MKIGMVLWCRYGLAPDCLCALRRLCMPTLFLGLAFSLNLVDSLTIVCPLPSGHRRVGLCAPLLNEAGPPIPKRTSGDTVTEQLVPATIIVPMSVRWETMDICRPQ